MDDVTPNDMPALKETETVQGIDEGESSIEQPEVKTDAAKVERDRIAELNREAAKHRHRAKEAEQRLEQIASLFGDNKSDEFDPRSAIEQMRTEFAAERRARLLSEVARTEGVEPEDIRGDTEEEMRESAGKFKERFEARLTAAVEAAVKARNPSAAPASLVTADGKIAGPEQITSREQLKSMTPQQIMEAQKGGRLDHLLGKKAI